MVDQSEESLDWLHYDYSWDEEHGIYVHPDGEPVVFSSVVEENQSE